LFSGALTMGGN